MKKWIIILNIPRILPAFLFYKLLRQNKSEVKKIDEDINAWKQWKGIDFLPFFYLFVFYPEFRNVFYIRIGKAKHFIKWLCPPLDSLYILTSNIGGGLKIQHGFSTVITAQSIGKDCHIFQQVTIGFNGPRSPIIGDNVTVCCGAKVIGGVCVGNNVVIGANAVVCKDVPDNCVVVGVPARIIKHLD